MVVYLTWKFYEVIVDEGKVIVFAGIHRSFVALLVIVDFFIDWYINGLIDISMDRLID